MFDTLIVWRVDWTAGFDAAWVDRTEERLVARGQIAAQRPRPYSVRYSLATETGFETRSLQMEVVTKDGTRQLSLAHEDGRWLVNDTPRPDLDGALDCDIDGCPLTNTMPILRHDLHRQPGEVTFSMAFVQLPELAVERSEQTYTHMRRIDNGHAVVRYRSGNFESDLLVDERGLVVEYPTLGAHRIEAQ